MNKIKNKPIPIYKTHKHYIQEQNAPQASVETSATALQHFEIHPRQACNSKVNIHRIDFYMIFIVTRGEGIHTFGLKEHYIKENMLGFIGPNMFSSWESVGDEQEGYFCTFSEDFFNIGRENKHFLNELPFFQLDGDAVLHLTDEQMRYYLSLFELMHWEYSNKNAYSDDVLRSQLQLLLHKAYAQYRVEECRCDKPNLPSIRLLKAFTALYQKDLKVIHEGRTVALKKMSEYARELGVSQNHLNDTVKAVTGKSAGQLIKSQLIKQATVCLKASTKSVSEIAYLLGYDDPSYFARYYKSQTGQSPSDLR
ncbi:AraC family transcriptional regulator [Rapidithrix thailandica]|uniref:AraC family transcriptional regulator n=1 Tax=Rapidithrix thailandica TaxID=413964 RepID=A0AAW9SCX0_9BACT